MSDKNPEKENMAPETSLYEVGFHIVPNLGEENVDAEYSALKSIVEDAGGLVRGEEERPKNITLSYPIEKSQEGKKTTFKNSYFGWFRFEAPSEAVLRINENLKERGTILRFLLIKPEIPKKVEKRSSIISKSPKKEKEARDEIKEEEVDKAIDELVIE